MTTKDDALKLALEALEFIPKSGSMLGTQAETKRLQAIAVMKEALVMQQISEPCRCGKQTNAWCMANTCSKAQQALDKKAENARELGLDYEPMQDGGIVTAGGSDPRTQRTWVGLTNNELQPIADEYRILFGSWVEDFARAIEAKLRSKNEDRN